MKKSKLLLVSWILTTAYVVYLVIYFSGTIASSSGTEQLGATLASVLVFPHALLVFIGLIFNVFAWLLSKRGFALTSGILYSVAMLLFIPYFFFILLQTVFCFVAYAKMKIK